MSIKQSPWALMLILRGFCGALFWFSLSALYTHKHKLTRTQEYAFFASDTLFVSITHPPFPSACFCSFPPAHHTFLTRIQTLPSVCFFFPLYLLSLFTTPYEAPGWTLLPHLHTHTQACVSLLTVLGDFFTLFIHGVLRRTIFRSFAAPSCARRVGLCFFLFCLPFSHTNPLHTVQTRPPPCVPLLSQALSQTLAGRGRDPRRFLSLLPLAPRPFPVLFLLFLVLATDPAPHFPPEYRSSRARGKTVREK